MLDSHFASYYDRLCLSHPVDIKQEFGRGERIRTSGLYVPNVALYQAKLHPDKLGDQIPLAQTEAGL